MLHRRSFLVAAGAAALGAGLGCSARRRGTVIGAGRFLTRDTGAMTHVLCLFDLDGDRSRAVPMDFFGHGLAPDPTLPRRAVMFEKKGPGCCELDLVDGRVVRPIETPRDRAFYGHGAFSADGRLLFATENRLDTKDGLIAVRDGRTFQELGEFPTHGKSPHDCHLIDGGRTLAITNGGGSVDGGDAPSVTFVDVASHKLLERLTFETPRINAGHLAPLGDHDVVAISAPRDGLKREDLGGISLRTGGGTLRTLNRPSEVIGRLVGESLSVCVEERRGVFGVTNPDGNIVTFWEVDGGRLVKHLDLPAPRGLARTLDGEYLVLSYGEGTLTLLSPESLEPVPLRRVERSTLSGSHIFTWDPLA